MCHTTLTEPKNSVIQCVPEKRKPINLKLIFLKTVFIRKKFTLLQNPFDPFFWHQLQDVLAMYGQARTISNGDVKIDLRRIGI